MKRPTTWRKNSSVRALVAYTPTRSRGHVDALGDHQHRHEPAAAAGGEAGDPRRRVGRVARHDLRPLAGDPLEPRGERLGVLLVCGDHEPAGVGMVAGADPLEPQHRVAQYVGDPVAVGVERRAQPAGRLGGGQADAEVGGAAAAVATSTPCRRRSGGTSPAGRRGRAARRCSRRSSRPPRRRRRRTRPTGSACRRSGTACRRAAAGSAPGRTPRPCSGPTPRARPCGAARPRSAASAPRRSGGGARPAPPRPSGRSPRRRAGRAARARRRSGGSARGRARSARRRRPTGGRCASSARRPPRARPGPR